MDNSEEKSSAGTKQQDPTSTASLETAKKIKDVEKETSDKPAGDVEKDQEADAEKWRNEG